MILSSPVKRARCLDQGEAFRREPGQSALMTTMAIICGRRMPASWVGAALGFASAMALLAPRHHVAAGIRRPRVREGLVCSAAGR